MEELSLFSADIHQEPKEKIQQRRLQILVHSYIYYELNSNVISDSTWDKWAMELVHLQKDYPDIAGSVIYANIFNGFDGSTGYDLAKAADEKTISKANYLLSLKNGEM